MYTLYYQWHLGQNTAKISLSGIKIALLQHAVYYQRRGRAIMRSTPSIYKNCVKNILTIHETRHQLDFSFCLRV